MPRLGRHERGLDHVQLGQRATDRRRVFDDDRQHFLHRQDPDDVIQVVIINREARVAFLGEDQQELAQRAVFLHRDDVGPRDHRLTHVPLAELERADEHLLLACVDHAALAALDHHVLEFLNVVNAMPTRLAPDAKEAQHARGRAVDQPDQRGGESGKQRHGAGDEQRGLRRVTQRDGFRRLFADDHVEERKQKQHEDGCQGRRDSRRDRGCTEHARQHRRQQRVERLFSHHAQQDRRNRDTELRARDRPIGIGQQMGHLPGSMVALFCQALHLPAAHGDDGELDRHKERVRQDDQHPGQDGPEQTRLLVWHFRSLLSGS